jgi:hypothetical protein
MPTQFTWDFGEGDEKVVQRVYPGDDIMDSEGEPGNFIRLDGSKVVFKFLDADSGVCGWRARNLGDWCERCDRETHRQRARRRPAGQGRQRVGSSRFSDQRAQKQIRHHSQS